MRPTEEASATVAPIDTGNTAPKLDETFFDAEGNPHNLEEALNHGPVLLGIYKSSCQASKSIFPILERIYQRHKDQGLTVYGISQDSPNVTRSFARRYGITFPILIEGETYPISRRFDIFATPTLYFIRSDHTVISSFMGFFREQVIDFANLIATELGTPTSPIIAEDETDIPLFVPG
jgi:peroxiredoxin